MCGILFQIMRAPPHKGGQITYLKYLISRLLKINSCDPCIIYSHRMREKCVDPSISKSFLNNKIITIRKGLPYSPYSCESVILKPLQTIYDHLTLRKVINDWNVRVFHVIGPGPEFSISIPPSEHIKYFPVGCKNPIVAIGITPWSFLKECNDIKKIYTMFDSPLITPAKIFYSKILKIVDIFDIIIVHLKESYLFTKKVLKEKGYDTNKVKFIPYGIDLSLFNPKKTLHMRTFDNVISSKELRILCPARIAPEKNQAVVLMALRMLTRFLKDYKITCTFAGEVQDRRYYNLLLNMIEEFNLTDKVVFLDGVQYSEMPLVYATHDIVIMPSVRELLSSAVLEAMAMNKPVICSRLPCNKLVYIENKHCLMFNPQDPKELTQKVLTLIQNPGLAIQITCAAHSLVEKHFDLEKSLDKTIDLYK